MHRVPTPKQLRAEVMRLFEVGGWSRARVKPVARMLNVDVETIEPMLAGGKRFVLQTRAGQTWICDTRRRRVAASADSIMRDAMNRSVLTKEKARAKYGVTADEWRAA